jgi:hypothetical protein
MTVRHDNASELESRLDYLKSLVEGSAVEEARSLAKELALAWPEHPRVQYWARVLAPPRVIGRSPATGYSLEREKPWLQRHAHEYPGCWIVLDGERLITADPDLVAARAAAKADGAHDPLFHFQPAEWP